MDINELKQRLDVIYSIICIAFLTKERYNIILNNKDQFSAVFPGLGFANPQINFSIEQRGVVFSTSKNELLNEHNHNLYKAWHVALGIVGMTSIMEYYLKTTAEKISGKPCKGMGIFYQFSEKTKIELKSYFKYDELHKYYQVRHLTIHNLGRIDQKFIDKIKSEKAKEDAYIFYPYDLLNFSHLIIGMAEYIEQKLKE